ncbi:hypothetical protein SAMN05216302_101187 [Nitrosomonas aestuarii]|uniref:Helix-turn-helix domain-containing protein n=1 Tax=Nitrosomonas aestuarii TaxID=52441 RepID=A0A1I4B8C3_9PROT|nr:hypothetical protein [Nitrosomonas aestuarii]SFK65035.1 hypothetical protein SAMN05216302_101187 [Nitrosomonas aestuarii]
MAKKKNWLSPERREPGGFAALPHCLLGSKVYIELSAHAVKLLNDLLAQFKGFNNGDLCLSWSIMVKRGWKSRDTLNKARKELLDVELIVVSRYGDRKRPHLYALTFFAIDECGGKLDVKATERPLSLWRLHEPLPQFKIKSTPTADVSKVEYITRPACDLSNETVKYNPPTVSDKPISQNL